MQQNLYRVFLCSLIFFTFGCSEQPYVIFCDEQSAPLGEYLKEKIDSIHQSSKVIIEFHSSDFLYQSLKQGRKADLVISIHQDHAQKFGISFPKTVPLARDMMVFATNDFQISSVNQMLTNGKHLALLMQNNALWSFQNDFLEFKKIDSEHYLPVYVPNSLTMALYLQKKLVSGGIMLNSLAFLHQLKAMQPFHHQKLVHFAGFRNEKYFSFIDSLSKTTEFKSKITDMHYLR